MGNGWVRQSMNSRRKEYKVESDRRTRGTKLDKDDQGKSQVQLRHIGTPFAEDNVLWVEIYKYIKDTAGEIGKIYFLRSLAILRGII